MLDIRNQANSLSNCVSEIGRNLDRPSALSIAVVSPSLADDDESISTSHQQGKLADAAHEQGKYLKSFSLLDLQNQTNSLPNCVSEIGRNLDRPCAVLVSIADVAHSAQADSKDVCQAIVGADCTRLKDYHKEMENKETDDLKDRIKIAESRLLETAQIAEARLLVLNELRAEIEDLNQKLISKDTWAVMRSVYDVIKDAISRLDKLPGYAIVPHMRKMTTFKSDVEAIMTAPTDEELKSANRFLKSLKFDISVRNFAQIGIKDAVAVTDREGTGDIWFSTDLQWGLERLLCDNDAQFVGLTTLYHETGHIAWFKFRGEENGSSPESFKGTLSKYKSDGTQVMHSSASPHRFQN